MKIFELTVRWPWATRSDGPRAAEDLDPPSDSDNPAVFVLKRELSEVHLLLDNISTNPNKSLAACQKDAEAAGLPKDWIEKICQINWPPSLDRASRRDQAALLVRAKDFLNVQTSPATGLTIAFTLLMTNEDDSVSRRRLREAGDSQTNAPTRLSLAKAAYPGLIARAKGFRRWVFFGSGALFVFLLCTVAMSCYVAYGNAALLQMVAAKTEFAATEKAVVEAETGKTPDRTGDQPSVGKPVAAPATTAKEPEKPVYRACDYPHRLAVEQVNGYKVQPFHNKDEVRICVPYWRAQRNVDHVNRDLLWWLFYLKVTQTPPISPEEENHPADVTSTASALTTILAGSVLPVMYGILGAGAAVLRSLSTRMKTSQIAPRHLPLSLLQLALGAVVGACISLFVGQPTSAGAGASPGLLGPVALSASALSFITGFGVEQVFLALEALLSRVFLGVTGSSNSTPAVVPTK